MSPTRRTSWAQHRRMMQSEGYDDSDTNENYRCLIKAEQRKLGVLPSAPKHADMVSDNKLQSIKDEIGEMNSTKLAMQEQGRKTRKLVKSVNADVLLYDEVKEALENKEFIKSSDFHSNISFANDNDDTLFVCLSDIHYGAFVDLPDNQYNTQIVAKRLEQYADKVVNLIVKDQIRNVHIVNLGDNIEHAYMRTQNLYNAEEDLSEQIVNVSDLIIKFIDRIASYVPETVTYVGIAGNHDRIQGDKNSNLNADHAVRIINKIIQVWSENSDSNIEFVNVDDYFTDAKANGISIAFEHGDRSNIQKKGHLADVSQLHGKHYSMVVGGHIHHFVMTEVGNNEYQINFGSIKGIDDYSIQIGAKSSPSQGVIVVHGDGKTEIKKINLD